MRNQAQVWRTSNRITHGRAVPLDGNCHLHSRQERHLQWAPRLAVLPWLNTYASFARHGHESWSATQWNPRLSEWQLVFGHRWVDANQLFQLSDGNAVRSIFSVQVNDTNFICVAFTKHANLGGSVIYHLL